MKPVEVGKNMVSKKEVSAKWDHEMYLKVVRKRYSSSTSNPK